jgi:hypothetical protein
VTSPDSCADIVRQMWPFLDDALPDAWRARVVAHLEHCADCRSHFGFERELLAAVREAAHAAGVDIPALHDRVVRALAAQGFGAP